MNSKRFTSKRCEGAGVCETIELVQLSINMSDQLKVNLCLMFFLLAFSLIFKSTTKSILQGQFSLFVGIDDANSLFGKTLVKRADRSFVSSLTVLLVLVRAVFLLYC